MVHTHWRVLWPRRGWHYSFWLAVGRRVKERGVRSTNRDEVRRICIQIEYEFSSKEAKRIQERQAFGSSAKDKADSG